MINIMKFLILSLFASVLFVGTAWSEKADKCKNSKADVTKTGVVASVGTYGTNASVDSSGSTATPGEEESLIS